MKKSIKANFTGSWEPLQEYCEEMGKWLLNVYKKR
jgi:hypothetical protein